MKSFKDHDVETRCVLLASLLANVLDLVPLEKVEACLYARWMTVNDIVDLLNGETDIDTTAAIDHIDAAAEHRRTEMVIATTRGYKTISQLKQGDEVISPAGTKHTILGTH